MPRPTPDAAPHSRSRSRSRSQSQSRSRSQSRARSSGPTPRTPSVSRRASRSPASAGRKAPAKASRSSDADQWTPVAPRPKEVHDLSDMSPSAMMHDAMELFKGLLPHHKVPEYLREKYVLHGYRVPGTPRRKLLRSLFSLHNETINVWTHLLGFLLFIGLLVYSMNHVPSSATVDRLRAAVLRYSPMNTLEQLEEMINPHHVPLWPVYVYCCCAATCLLMSTLFHLFGSHSHRTFFMLARCDYSGIALLIAGSCFPAFYYGFYCSSTLKMAYLMLMCAFGAAITIMCNMTWFYQAKFRLLRAMLFVTMGVSGVVPALHMLYITGHPFVGTFLLYMVGMGVCYLAGVALYATRIPERYAPGRFDIFGHSHQIFHVLVVTAALIHFVGCVKLHQELTTVSCELLGTL